MAEFKKIAGVDFIDKLTEKDRVLIVAADGALKQTYSSNIKGSGNGGYVLKLTNDNYSEVNYSKQCFENYDVLYEAAMAGSTIWLDFSEVHNNGHLNLALVSSLWLESTGLWIYSGTLNILFPNGSHHQNVSD